MELVAYASRTGTRRNLASLRAHGWRLLVSAAGVWRTEGFAWAADNGQWAERDDVGPFKADRFFRFVAWCMAQPVLPDWIVLPDIVQGGSRSLALTMRWLRWFRSSGLLRRVRVLIAVQDGMEAGVMFARIKQHLGERVGVFVGGSTEWKVGTMPLWCRVARAACAICHIGRVNSQLRIGLCEDAGATSFDGSNASRFSKNTPKLDAARRQSSLFGHLARLDHKEFVHAR